MSKSKNVVRAVCPKGHTPEIPRARAEQIARKEHLERYQAGSLTQIPISEKNCPTCGDQRLQRAIGSKQ